MQKKLPNQNLLIVERCNVSLEPFANLMDKRLNVIVNEQLFAVICRRIVSNSSVDWMAKVIVTSANWNCIPAWFRWTSRSDLTPHVKSIQLFQNKKFWWCKLFKLSSMWFLKKVQKKVCDIINMNLPCC